MLYCTVVFQERAFNSSTGYMYLQSVAEYMHPEHKASKRSQPEITAWYLSLINHYVDTIFVLSDLGTGQELSHSTGILKNI